MRNQIFFIFLILTLAGGTAFGRDYRLEDRQSEDLAGIDTVIFETGGISCALCIRTMDVSGIVRGA